MVGGGLAVLLRHGTQMIRDALLLGRHVQHLVASVASQGRFPVAGSYWPFAAMSIYYM